MTETAGVKTLLGDPKVAIPAIAMPLALAILIQNINSVADFMWVSWLGAKAVAGVGLAYPLYASLCGVGNGIAVGVSAAIARSVGLRDREKASRSAGQSLLLTVVFSIILMAVLVPIAGPVMDIFGDSEASDAALAYSMPMFIFGICLIGSSVMSGIMRGEGAARASMAIQIVGAATNIILDPILIYVLGMGVSGAGYATVIASLASIVLGMFIYLGNGKMYVCLRVKDLVPDIGLCKDILVVGLPQSAEYVVMSLINLPMNFIITGVGGADAVGIYTSAWRVAYIVFVPAQAYSGAVVSVCSAEYSSNRPDLVRDAYVFTVKRSVRDTLVLSVIMAILCYPLACIFTMSEDLQYLRNELALLFVCMAIMLPVMSQVFVGSGFLQALKHSEVALISSLIRNILMVAAYAFGAWVVSHVYSIWIAMTVTEVIGGLLMAALAWKYVSGFYRAKFGKVAKTIL